jgi:hypothetical protein
MTDKRERSKPASVESACQIPPSVVSKSPSMQWLKPDWSSKQTQVTAFLVVVILLLTPLLLGFYFTYVYRPTGIVEIDSGEDTFVSSNNSQDHSQYQLLRVSNYSEDSESIFEVGFFKFVYVPPPAGGRLVDAHFIFHCSVVSSGQIELHIVDSNGLWSTHETDLDNLTYSTMPPYESVPFAALVVNSNGTYSIRIFRQGGIEQGDFIGIVGLAITAQQGTQILIDSFEGAVEDRPKLTMTSTVGILVRNPFLYYLNPFLIIPVAAGIILTLIVIGKLRHRKYAAGIGFDSQ